MEVTKGSKTSEEVSAIMTKALFALKDLVDNDSENETEELNDYYSDNFSDEEEICEGLENNLEEIDFLFTDVEERSLVRYILNAI